MLAAYDRVEDRLTLLISTQTPHVAMRMLCDLLGRDENQVRVMAPDVGGGFGPKLVFYQEEIAVALAALLLDRPVKWIEDRREHFVSTTQERDQYWDVEIAVDADARIRGVRGLLIHDHGAYTARGVNVPYGSAAALTLCYNVPAYPARHQARAHQQGAGDAGARRRPAAGRVRDGAAARSGGARARCSTAPRSAAAT